MVPETQTSHYSRRVHSAPNKPRKPLGRLEGESMRVFVLSVALIMGATHSVQAKEERLLWGIQIEQLEHRFGDDTDVQAWDADVFVGSDELKAV